MGLFDIFKKLLGIPTEENYDSRIRAEQKKQWERNNYESWKKQNDESKALAEKKREESKKANEELKKEKELIVAKKDEKVIEDKHSEEYLLMMKEETDKAEYRSKTSLNQQVKDLIEKGNSEYGGIEGLNIKEFNDSFNGYRDLVVRILSEKGVIYDDQLANSLADYIEKNSINDNYKFGIKDRKQFYQYLYGNIEKLSYNPNPPEFLAQTRLEAFEFDLIINNETNKHRVSKILEALSELNNIINELYPYLYKTVCEVLMRKQNIMEIMQSKFLNNENMDEMIELHSLEAGKIGMRLLMKIIPLADTNKFYHNTIYQNLATLDHTYPYEIKNNIGYDKVYINASLALFCEEKRDEILEALKKKQSDFPDQANDLLNRLIKPED